MSDRNLSLLTDDNRFVRKKALTEILEFLSDSSNSSTYLESSLAAYASSLSASLNDPIEVNRELAIKANHELLVRATDIQPILPTLFPVLAKRFGQNEIVEPAEELRLDSLKLISVVLEKNVDISPYIDDILLIIQHSLLDPFHEVKKLCCTLIQDVAKKKIYRFYQISESVIGPLVSNLVHQHSKVRLYTVQAIGTIMLFSQGKLVDQLLTPLTQRLFDDASSVRRSVVELVGCWLLELPDRYSYHTKLLPLILSGLVDESEDIRQLAEDLWDDIGLKFEKENEDQLKDKLDFDKGVPLHFPLGCRRPNLGCRELVYRSASRILPALCRDLSDWQPSTRSKAASLIPVIILHLEEATTQHTQNLITGLSSGLADAVAKIAPCTGSVAVLRMVPPLAFEMQPLPKMPLSVNQTGPQTLVPRIPSRIPAASAEITESLGVVQHLLLAAELTGAMVKSELWWDLTKSCLDRCTESAAPASLAGYLLLLAGLLSGSSFTELSRVPESKVSTEDAELSGSMRTILHSIVFHLSGDDFLSVVSFATKAALLECVLLVLHQLEMCVVMTRMGNSCVKDVVEEKRTYFERLQNSANILVCDTKIRSMLFQIILALGAVWTDADAMSTDFGTSFIQLILEATRRLASCERDLEPEHDFVDDTSCPNGYSSDLLRPASAADVDRLYIKHMPKLLERLEASQTESGSWHPRSVGLAIFSRCLQTAGPSLLANNSQAGSSLATVLRLLERGCRLDRVPGSENKTPGGLDPMTMAAESELRLRGLMLLTRLTDNGPVRQVLASPALLSRCLTHLILPACVWRAGRTAEAMRKAAVTCLVALSAAATNIFDLDESNVDSRTADEVHLDRWLCDHIECVRKLLGSQIDVNAETTNSKHTRRSSLPTLSHAVLSLLLTRLGALLEDDLEATRKMACLNVTILFNGLLLPVTDHEGPSQTQFFQSPTWLSGDNPSPPTANQCPLPNSFGDQVYRFYPNLIKRLNDTKDSIRLLVTESLNAWFRITRAMLTCSPAGDNTDSTKSHLNPVHSAVIEDLINGLMPHLDDTYDSIRGAVARVMARIGMIAPDLVSNALKTAAGRHRSSELCHQLAEASNQTF